MALSDQRQDQRYTLHIRRQGRKLRPGQAELFDTLLPRLTLKLPPGNDPVDLRGLFAAKVAAVNLEIGFGGGEHLLWQVRQNPHIGFIGAEPFVNGVAKLLAACGKDIPGNLLLIPGDVRPVLDQLVARAPGAISRLFILFPDPWPKARHHKRRILGPATLDSFAAILADGADLRFASDIMDYIDWSLMHTCQHPAFIWTASKAADWRQRPADWPSTRYEKKAIIQGRTSAYLSFRRQNRDNNGLAGVKRLAKYK